MFLSLLESKHAIMSELESITLHGPLIVSATIAWLIACLEVLRSETNRYKLRIFSREPRLRGCVRLSVGPSVRPSVMLFSRRAETSRRTTYFVYTNLFVSLDYRDFLRSQVNLEDVFKENVRSSDVRDFLRDQIDTEVV